MLTKVFKVVREIGEFPRPVDLFAGGAVGLRHRPRSATEHADFADITVLFLHEL